MRDELVFGGTRAARAAARAHEREARAARAPASPASVELRVDGVPAAAPVPSSPLPQGKTQPFDLESNEWPPLESVSSPVPPPPNHPPPVTPRKDWPNVLTISMPVKVQQAISRIHYGGGQSNHQLTNQCYIFAVMRCLLKMYEKEPRLLTEDCAQMFESLTKVSAKNTAATRARSELPETETDSDVQKITSQKNLVDLYLAIYHEYFYNTPWHQEKDRTLERGSAGRVVSAMAQAGCFNEKIKIYLTGDKYESFGEKVLGSEHLKTPYHGLYYEMPEATNLGDNHQDALEELKKGFSNLTRELQRSEYNLELELLGGVFSIIYQGEARKYDHYYWFDVLHIYNDTTQVENFLKDTTKDGTRGLCDDLVFFFKISRVDKEKVSKRLSMLHQN